MKIGYILFDGITLLDFIGIYDPISRLKSMKFMPDLSWELCAYTPSIKDGFGLTMIPTYVKQPLSDFDVIIVPGGFGTRPLQEDSFFISWLQGSKEGATMISICTGSLLLGAAGYLKSKRATTNFNEYETLAPYCEEVVKERIVADGNLITAGAVSSSIDLGLYLCEKWAGQAAKEAIKEKMAYPC